MIFDLIRGVIAKSVKAFRIKNLDHSPPTNFGQTVVYLADDFRLKNHPTPNSPPL
jgi:hypothetical protein